MRPAVVAASVLCALALPTASDARSKIKRVKVAGTYSVAFTSEGNTCDPSPIELTRGDLTVEQSGSRVTVSFPMIPIMRGTATDAGAISARAKRGKTAVQGLDGEFSVGGKVGDDRTIELTLVASYFVGGKAYCQRSWTAKGASK